VPEALARFRREARVTSELGHPNIVAVVESGETEAGAPYLVMELLEGEDLATLLEREGKLAPSRALAIFAQVASAVGTAHALGVVHRDLKPPNLFVTRGESGIERVKVLDFGVSKVQGGQSVMTRSNASLGTPGYMSPEQVEGRSATVDARADIFAIGAILYQMLAGRPPFVDLSIPALLHKVVHSDPPPLRALCPGISPVLAEAIERALRKDPAGRFASVEEMAAALAPLAEAAAPSSSPSPRRQAPGTGSLRWVVLFGLIGLLAGGGVVLLLLLLGRSGR
jgi:serine/threonine-protein kinase